MLLSVCVCVCYAGAVLAEQMSLTECEVTSPFSRGHQEDPLLVLIA